MMCVVVVVYFFCLIMCVVVVVYVFVFDYVCGGGGVLSFV
jgi:hypothetical protein